MQNTKSYSIRGLLRATVLAIIVTFSSAIFCEKLEYYGYEFEVYLDYDTGKDGLLLLATHKEDPALVDTVVLRRGKRVPFTTSVSGYNYLMSEGNDIWPAEDVLFSFLYRHGKKEIITIVDSENNEELCRWDYDSPYSSERAFFEVDNWNCTFLSESSYRFVFTINEYLQ